MLIVMAFVAGIAATIGVIMLGLRAADRQQRNDSLT
jgi:hypothetical protein